MPVVQAAPSFSLTLLIKQCRDFPRPERWVEFGGGSWNEPVSGNIAIPLELELSLSQCQYSLLSLYRMSADEAKEPPADAVWAPSLEDLIGPRPEGVTLTTGFVSVPGDMQVKWWRFDPPPSVTEEGVAVSRPPVIALHGGPAFTHHCECSAGVPISPPFSRHARALHWQADPSTHHLPHACIVSTRPYYETGITISHSLDHSSLSPSASLFPLPPSLHVPRIPSVLASFFSFPSSSLSFSLL